MAAELGQGQENNKTGIMPCPVRRPSDAFDAVLDLDERRGLLRSSAVRSGWGTISDQTTPVPWWVRVRFEDGDGLSPGDLKLVLRRVLERETR